MTLHPFERTSNHKKTTLKTISATTSGHPQTSQALQKGMAPFRSIPVRRWLLVCRIFMSTISATTSSVTSVANDGNAANEKYRTRNGSMSPVILASQTMMGEPQHYRRHRRWLSPCRLISLSLSLSSSLAVEPQHYLYTTSNVAKKATWKKEWLHFAALDHHHYLIYLFIIILSSLSAGFRYIGAPRRNRTGRTVGGATMSFGRMS
jgi:hypothetical protein